MKILVIIFCFLTTKSVLGMNGVASLRHLTHSRRRFSPPNPPHPYRRLNPEIIKLIFLKRLLEMDCLKSVFYRNCEVDKFFKHQKLPTGMNFDGLSASRNIHPVILRNGLRRDFSINPKFIIVPPVRRHENNFQNLKQLKNFPQYLRTLPKETKEDRTEELFQKEENFRPILKNMTIREENNTVLHPNPITNPEITPDLLLSPKPTQVYEVEEIFEDEVNMDEDDINKMRVLDYKNKIKSSPNDKEVINNSILSIIKEMTEPDMNIINEGAKTKAPARTATTAKFQNSSLDVKKSINNEIMSVKSTGDFKKYSNRGIVEQSLPVKKEENSKPLNEVQKTEEKKLKSVTQKFFEFFNKGPIESIKPTVPERSNKFTSKPLTSMPIRNQHFLKNLIKDNEILDLVKAPSSPAQSTSQNFTTSARVNDATLVPRALNTQTFSTADFEKEITEESKTTRILQSSTTFSSVTQTKEFSDVPLSIDLLSTSVKPELKKEQESVGKNSRKMNFGQETVFNSITDSSDQQPRRSDILITDDYRDNDLSSSKTYFEKLHPNGTIDDATNTTIDFFIPLIPEILNDIREDKISPQDLSLLSTVFGKYWSNILDMSNNTKLDFLPLLTMKNEKDLINVIESNLLTESKTSTTETDEVKLDRKNSQKQYDYMDEYKDLYDYILGQEKRKRYKDEEYEKVEAANEDFEILEDEQNTERMEYEIKNKTYEEPEKNEKSPVLDL